ALPQAGAADETAPPRPGIGTPVAPLTDRDEKAAPAPAGPPPIERFAVPFDNPGEQPLMSILLIDGQQSIGAEALAEFPYPLTFAVDPAAPDAAAKMARHRAAGFEVVMLADLPAAATPQDAEVALSVWRKAVPEAVAVLEGTGPGIQGNRALSDQVTAIVQDAGLGLITQSNGLNTVQKLAARAGVPSAVVFRDFDGAGQSPAVMRRFLDQAAFRAGQEGAVIMLGRVQPDTISALLLWGLQDRAQRVALAPVSAVLLEQPRAE
ncbi:divergent polysaccharide deacetylase family protein, partial [Antarcticimicrobium luteum]